MKIFPVQLNISLTSFSIDNKKLNITVTFLSSWQQIPWRNNLKYRITLLMPNWSNLLMFFLCWYFLFWTHLRSQISHRSFLHQDCHRKLQLSDCLILRERIGCYCDHSRSCSGCGLSVWSVQCGPRWCWLPLCCTVEITTKAGCSDLQ